MRIIWYYCLITWLLFAAGAYGMIFVKILGDAKWQTHLFAKLLIMIGTTGTLAGCHRLWSHRAFKVTRIGEVVMMLFATVTYQTSIFMWVRDHRLHHKYVDTDMDPHNSRRGFLFSHVGWAYTTKHPDLKAKHREVDMSEEMANPVVMFQHRHYLILALAMNLLIPIGVPYYFWNETFYNAFWMDFYRYFVSLNMILSINSISHMFGTKPYNKKIYAVQGTWFIPWSLGEGFHNYHHVYPHDYRASEYTCDVRNLATVLIDAFAKLGWAYDLKTTPREIVDRRLKSGSGDGTRTDLPSVFNNICSILIYLVM